MEPSSKDSQQEGGQVKDSYVIQQVRSPTSPLILPHKQGLYKPLFPQVPGLLDQGFFSLYFDLDFCFVFLK